MKTIVAGANGFLGSAFLRASISRYGHVIGLTRGNPSSHMATCDYSIPSLAKIFYEFQPELVVLAVGTPKVSESLTSPHLDRTNSVGTISKILDALSSCKQSPKIFFTSTAAVYGAPTRLPISEDEILAPISPYGAHRAECEQLLFKFGQNFNSKVVAGRAFSLFGDQQKHMVLWELAKQAITNTEVVIQGTGYETRDYLHVDEFARRGLNAIEACDQTNLALNIASGETTTILDLAQMIVLLIGKPLPIRTLDQEHPGNPKHWSANIARYIALTSDNSHRNLKEDLALCLKKWIVNIEETSSVDSKRRAEVFLRS